MPISFLDSALWLLLAQGFLGAFDTIYFHELRTQLPALQSQAKSELILHSLRSLIYSIFLLTLPWLSWQGWCTIILVLFSQSALVTYCKWASLHAAMMICPF